MKKYIIILLVLSCINTYAQKKINLSSVKSTYLKSILCAVDTVIFKTNANVFAILYKVGNSSGSAHMPETDEATSKFLIAISSVDSAPERNLYSIGNFYNPKIIEFKEIQNEHFLLTIEYGVFNHRKKNTFNISLKSIFIEQS